MQQNRKQKLVLAVKYPSGYRGGVTAAFDLANAVCRQIDNTFGQPWR